MTDIQTNTDTPPPTQAPTQAPTKEPQFLSDWLTGLYQDNEADDVDIVSLQSQINDSKKILDQKIGDIYTKINGIDTTLNTKIDTKIQEVVGTSGTNLENLVNRFNSFLKVLGCKEDGTECAISCNETSCTIGKDINVNGTLNVSKNLNVSGESTFGQADSSPIKIMKNTTTNKMDIVWDNLTTLITDSANNTLNTMMNTTAPDGSTSSSSTNIFDEVKTLKEKVGNKLDNVTYNNNNWSFKNGNITFTNDTKSITVAPEFNTTNPGLVVNGTGGTWLKLNGDIEGNNIIGNSMVLKNPNKQEDRSSLIYGGVEIFADKDFASAKFIKSYNGGFQALNNGSFIQKTGDWNSAAKNITDAITWSDLSITNKTKAGFDGKYALQSGLTELNTKVGTKLDKITADVNGNLTFGNNIKVDGHLSTGAGKSITSESYIKRVFGSNVYTDVRLDDLYASKTSFDTANTNITSLQSGLNTANTNITALQNKTSRLSSDGIVWSGERWQVDSAGVIIHRQGSGSGNTVQIFSPGDEGTLLVPPSMFRRVGDNPWAKVVFNRFY